MPPKKLGFSRVFAGADPHSQRFDGSRQAFQCILRILSPLFCNLAIRWENKACTGEIASSFLRSGDGSSPHIQLSKPTRRLDAATGPRRSRRFNPRPPERAKSFHARANADAEAG
jgi:hypothetical protein